MEKLLLSLPSVYLMILAVRAACFHPSFPPTENTELDFEIEDIRGGMVQYTPLSIGLPEEGLADFIANDIFFEKRSLPIFLCKLVMEVCMFDEEN